MAESRKVIDGRLEITTSTDVTVSTMERGEVVGKIAEIQTEVDHLNIDLQSKQVKLDKWKSSLTDIDKVR